MPRININKEVTVNVTIRIDGKFINECEYYCKYYRDSECLLFDCEIVDMNRCQQCKNLFGYEGKLEKYLGEE